MATRTKLKLKKSSVAGKVPLAGDLEFGELAINYNDGKLYYKDTSNTIQAFGDSANITTLVTNLVDSDYVESRTSVASLVDSNYVNNLIDVATVTDYTYQPSSASSTFSDSDINGNILSYTPNYIDVYLNGIRLSPTLDYTATNGTSVVLLGDTISSGDTLNITGRTRISLANGIDQLGDSAATGTTTIDSFLMSQYRSAKYFIQLGKSNKYRISEVMIIHDDSDVFISEYGIIETNGSVGTIDASTDGTTVYVNVTPDSDNTDVKFKRLPINA